MKTELQHNVMSTATGIRLRVETGKATFTPVSYNSFDVGSVSVEVDFPPGTDVAEALVEMDALASKHFGGAYQRRLEQYLRALRYNDKALRDDREAHRG